MPEIWREAVNKFNLPFLDLSVAFMGLGQSNRVGGVVVR